ncbi:uncharacterized protein LODBEIA_P51620 [Lodderomyces beijingensis]|uniref:Uncharacterized protein n=1 Tax=Lodderomyces beijingensis TaxID=1775926 RepID=A0ABP0ZTC3_9ASCO
MSTINVGGDEIPKVTASLLPMHLQYSGPAKTAEYFTPSHATETQHDGTQVKTAYFRGCRLVAKEVDLKQCEMQGFIVNGTEVLVREANEHQEKEEEAGEEVIKSVKTFAPTATFDKLVLFGHDEEVESSDQWRMIPEFLEVSKVVHG